MMLVIGSRALEHHGLIDYDDIKNSDWDFIADQGSWNAFKAQMLGIEVAVNNPDVRAFKCMHNGRETHFEAYIVPAMTRIRQEVNKMLPEDFTSSFELLRYSEEFLTKDNISGFYWATPEMCLAIKMSHRFKKNNPFFRKTMHHIRFLRNKGVKLSLAMEEIMLLRQKETLNYNHPKLDVNKSTFFNDTIYTLDHDSIHRAVALADRPAYTFYMKDGSEVMTSREKFESLPEAIKLAGVYEETCVLALERSQVPNNFQNVSSEHSFMMALEKVCTSITSGWFREYAWENYHKVVHMYKTLGVNDYIDRFHKNEHLILPFQK
ncbi:prohead assembly scaffold protein [Klebsiella phage vB_KpnM-VAC36]|nr:prohead assembly scaffold protein [Klebsiella phage vB_KpnM-VAC36]